jgi:hypothetical protein
VRPFDPGQLFPGPTRLISYRNNRGDGNHRHRSPLPGGLLKKVFDDRALSGERAEAEDLREDKRTSQARALCRRGLRLFWR